MALEHAKSALRAAPKTDMSDLKGALRSRCDHSKCRMLCQETENDGEICRKLLGGDRN